MSSLSASIVIATLNRDKPLCDTISFFLPVLHSRPDLELLVIDQSRAHNSETQAFLQSVASKIRLFTVPFVGTTKARNFGTAHARGDVVIFTDDDVEPLEEFIENHLKDYQDPAISGVAGCALPPGGRKLTKSELSQRELHRLATAKYTRFDVDFPYEVTWATGCNMSFRREAIIQTGGFDEEFYGVALGEEPEFCHRLLARGGRMRYAPTATLIHHAWPSGGSRNEQQERARIVAIADNAGYHLRRADATYLKTASDLWLVYRGLALGRKCMPRHDTLKRSWWFFTGLRQAERRCQTPQHLRSAERREWETTGWKPLESSHVA